MTLRLKHEDYLRFIHFDGFTADWKGLRLGDDDLRILQLGICAEPLAGSVIPGAGGLRKLRFAPPSWKRGKRGALRVLYAIFPEHAVCILAAAYQKSEQENITPAEKRQLKLILHQIADELDRQSGAK